MPNPLLIELSSRLELPPYHNGRPTLDLSTLHQSMSRGLQFTERYLNAFRTNLVNYRIEMGVSPNLKTQSALLLHLEHIGDPNQLIVDTADPDSCLTYGQFLFENGATEIWLGTAHDNDMTDIHGNKEAETPLIRGIKSVPELDQIIKLLWGKVSLDQISPSLLQANLGKAGKQRLEKVEDFIPNYYTNKLAKRCAMASNKLSHRAWGELTNTERSEYLAEHHDYAQRAITQILTGSYTWDKLNAQLKSIHQLPINPEDHPLHKMFRQDKNEWQIADIMATDKSIVIEIPRDKFTHREDDGNGIIKLVLTYENGQPLVVCDARDQEWLPYLINSVPLIKIFEQKCLPRLSKTDYYQLEIMLDTNSQKVAFGTDAIAGLTHSQLMKRGRIKPPLSLADFLKRIDKAKFRSTTAQKQILELEHAYEVLSSIEQGYPISILPSVILHILSVIPNIRTRIDPDGLVGVQRKHSHGFSVAIPDKDTARISPAGETIYDPEQPTKKKQEPYYPISLRPTQRDLGLVRSMIAILESQDVDYPSTRTSILMLQALTEFRTAMQRP